jgi:hypothetical protein
MSLVVLIIGEMDQVVETDMRRWWRGHCIKRVKNGETYFEVGYPVRYNVQEGVKRLASFGVKARAAFRGEGG